MCGYTVLSDRPESYRWIKTIAAEAELYQPHVDATYGTPKGIVYNRKISIVSLISHDDNHYN